MTSEGEGPGSAKKYDFDYLFKFNFSPDTLRESVVVAARNSSTRSIKHNEGIFLKKPADYMQAPIDQLVDLHFTACCVGSLVSEELSARKVNLSREREAVKAIDALKAEVAKFKAETAVEEKERTILENHLSRARLTMKDAVAKTKFKRGNRSG